MEPDADSWVEVPRGVPSESTRTQITEDGKVVKFVIEAGQGIEKPPPMARVYCHLEGKTADGAVFLTEMKEEFDFQLGRGEVATGLQMALTTMTQGERALIICGPGYGYSDLRRPAGVASDAELHFEVKLLWFEMEPSLTDMALPAKLSFADSKRETGKRMFAAGLYVSASKQYDRGLTVLSFGPGSDEVSDDPRGKAMAVIFHTNIAACSHKLGDFGAAITHCDKALKLDPASVKALFRRGQASLASGNLQQARQDLDSCLALTSTVTSAPAGLAREVKAAVVLLAREEAALSRRQAGAFTGMFERGSLYDDKVAPVSVERTSVCGRIMGWVAEWCRLPSKQKQQ